MLDHIADAASTFDWMTPIATVVRNVVDGPACMLVAPHSDWSRPAMAQLLRQHGISSWGWTVLDGDIAFWVPKKQARLATHVITQRGSPNLGEEAAASHPPIASGDLLGQFIDSLADMLGL